MTKPSGTTTSELEHRAEVVAELHTAVAHLSRAWEIATVRLAFASNGERTGMTGWERDMIHALTRAVDILARRIDSTQSETKS